MIVRFLFILAVFWVVTRLMKLLITGQGRPTSRPDWPGGFPRPGAPRVDGGELVQDPQCGVYVPKATAVKGRGGTCFCSESCRSAYESEST